MSDYSYAEVIRTAQAFRLPLGRWVNYADYGTDAYFRQWADRVMNLFNVVGRADFAEYVEDANRHS